MPAQWTGAFIGRLHTNNISAKDFAVYVGINPRYLSAVLNGKRNPKNAEKRFNEALDRLLEERSE